MMQKIDQFDIEHKQKLLKQHRRNLNYLTQQAASYGFKVPLDLHNALVGEQNAIASLERELASLGVLSPPKAKWTAAVIDNDSHWCKIITSNIGQLGGTAIEYHTIPGSNEHENIEACAMAIVGILPQIQTEPSADGWFEALVKFGCTIPLILLVSQADKDKAIALRQAFHARNMDVTVATIYKETFDLYWFSKIVHQILVY